MDESTSKEKILKRIRRALPNPELNRMSREVNKEAPIFHEHEEGLPILFAEKLRENSGEFIFCDNIDVAVSNLASLLEHLKPESLYLDDPGLKQVLNTLPYNFQADISLENRLDVAITPCDYLVARHGSAIITGNEKSVFETTLVKTHIILAYKQQLVESTKEALRDIKNRFNIQLPPYVSMISGPSRTADIEGELILGAQGPEALYVLFVYE